MAAVNLGMPRRPRPVVAAEWSEIRERAKLEDWNLKCDGRPELYVDYDAPGRLRPTKEEAEELCRGCRVYDLHAEYALVTRQAWGVAGGQVWEKGHPAPGTDRTRARQRSHWPMAMQDAYNAQRDAEKAAEKAA